MSKSKHNVLSAYKMNGKDTPHRKFEKSKDKNISSKKTFRKILFKIKPIK